MSYVFDVGDDTIWSPSLRVGRRYVALADCVADELGKNTGLDAIADDMYEIDPPVFGGFVKAVYNDFFSTDHEIHRELLRGWLSVSLVLMDRAGIPIDQPTEEKKAFVAGALEYGRSMPT